MKASLVLCHLADRSAVRVYCALRERVAPGTVELVSSEELVLAPRWRHATDADGVATELRLADGRRFDAESLGLVFQRLQRIEMPQFERSAPQDREYASAEMQALLLSWLESLPCPVVNPAGPRGLCGADRSLLEWMKLAARAGLPSRGFELVSDVRRFGQRGFAAHLAVGGTGSTDPPLIPRPELIGRGPAQLLERLDGPERRVLIAGAACLGSPTDELTDACVRLARLSGDHLLEVRLATVRGEWRFCGATPTPEIPGDAARFVADSLAAIEKKPA